MVGFVSIGDLVKARIDLIEERGGGDAGLYCGLILV